MVDKSGSKGNKDDSKGKTSISIGDRKIDMTPLCYKCSGHGHYAIVCLV